jgi:hypothetical protein
MSTTVCRIFLAAATVAALAAPAAQAAIIRASAGLGTQELPAANVGRDYQLGFRFTLSSVARVEHVGGRMFREFGTLFAAIVSLSGPDAVPAGDPFDLTTLATTVFTPPVGPPSVDIRVPLPITLYPGSYALIFGSEHYGANGAALMPLLNPDIADPNSFVAHGIGDNPWRVVVLDGPPRFVVEGVVIPEPGTALLAAAAMGILGLQNPRAIFEPATRARVSPCAT